MAIDAGVVRRLERLAALRLDDSERERLAADLARVVDYVGQLGGLDGVPAAAATAGAAGTTAAAAAAGAAGATAGGADWRPDGAGTLTLGPAAPRRADEPRPCLPRAEALAQAPEASGGHFRVPPVFGGREGRADVAGPAPPAAGPPPEEPPPGALRSSEPPPAGRSPEARAPLAPASELLSLTALGAARLLRRGEVSAAELDRALREAIAARDGSLRAYVWLADPAADPAGASEAPPTGPPPPLAERPLWGLGGALKANLMSAGHPADCGSRLLAPLRGLYDAEVVARLRAAGAHVVGKTNMDEFAMGSSTEHSAHGPTRNPWDLERVPGGSSGGAAAAVAADLAWFALGSDTGGSARQPAHCCGLVGLKPTYGRVSRRGLVAFASSLDQVGPLAKDVADCAAVYAAVAGHDPGDSTSLDAPVGDPLAAVERSPRGLAVGAPRALLETGLAPDVAADFAACLDDLQAQGVTVVDVGLPALPYAVAAYCVLATAEASANLARYDGARYGARAAGCDYAAMAAATRAAGFGPEVKRRILLGAYVLSAGYYDAYYRRALAARGRLGADFARAFAVCDAVVLPTASTAAFRLGERTGDPLRMYLSDVFTTAANLTGLPAVTVPTGLDRDGLPLSLQLIGPALREETLLTLAAAVERARGFRARKEAAWTSRR